MSTPERAGSLLVIRLFGPFDVRLNGVALPRLRTRKGEWLLALLALQRGRDVERAWLAGTLWPENSAPHALTSLRRSLNDLRAALGPEAYRLQSPSHRALRLELAGAEVDVVAFDAAIADGDEAGLERAVRLYHGPLLEGCCEEWVLLEREVRAQAYLDALERLAGWAGERGEPAAAAGRLRRVIAADPLRESAARALMQALTASGNPAAATAVFRELRLRLHHGLNLQPAPETTALFHQLRAEARRRPAADGRPNVLPPPATGALFGSRNVRGAAGAVPQPLTDLVGREKELGEIEARVAVARLVTLIGTGGVGKTRLAIQVAQELADDFADGARFVDLAALSDSSLVPQCVARVLGVPEQPGCPVIETLLAALLPMQLLLVLDNCEHLIAPAPGHDHPFGAVPPLGAPAPEAGGCAALAGTLLQGCPQLQILATSRQALGITGETTWRVPSLSLPAAVSGIRCSVLGSDRSDGSVGSIGSVGSTFAGPNTEHPTPNTQHLLQSEAVRLLVQRAIAAAPGFTLTERNAAAVVQVCRRLDGIPLAIELAAARLKAISVDELAARLDDRFRLLVGGSRTALPRQQTLRATIDWSYDLLSEPERALLRRLSVFSGGWTLAAAEAVCNEEVLDLLTALVDKSLVIYEEHDDGSPRSRGSRYRLLETVRQYVRERLLETEEADRIPMRHRDWFLALAEQAEPELLRSNQSVWFDRLEAEHDNLRAALAWCDGGEQGAEPALRMAGALGAFWTMRGYWTEGLERLVQILTLPQTAPRRVARAKALHCAGLLACCQGNLGLARAFHEESLAIQQEREDNGGIAASLHGLGHVAYMTGENEAARGLHEASLALRREQGDQAGVAASLAHLACLALGRDDYPAARALFQESRALYQELGDGVGTASALTGLGHVARRQGEYAAARALMEEGLALRRAQGDRVGLTQSLVGLGEAILDQGDSRAARAYCEEALELRQEVGDRAGVADTLGLLAEVARQQGDYAQACRLREESLALWRVMGYPIAVIHSLGALGHLAREQGEYAAARRLYAESLRLRKELGDRMTLAQSLEDFAELAAAEGQWARMTRLLGAARALRDAADRPLLPGGRASYEELLAAARGALTEESLAAVWAAGQAMTLEEAVSFGLDESG